MNGTYRINDRFGELRKDILDYFNKNKVHPFEAYTLLVSILFYLTHEFDVREQYSGEREKLEEESLKTIETIEKNIKNLFKELKGIEFDEIKKGKIDE